MRHTRASERLLVWQLSDQLRSDVRKLTRGEGLDCDYKLRGHIEDAAGEVVHNIEKALATDHDGEFARYVRIARTAVSDLQTGLRIALMKKRVSQRDLGEAQELCARLYPALASLLVQSASYHERPIART
ncbi:MAG TPA: four helix bundle protein [Vicinamibacterales bacterium]|nr:four helix bundle protein [Vicinamibacterales bacterium]